VKRVKIVVTAPTSDTSAIRNALGAAGAGKIGEYTFCSFSVVGVGRFLPSDKANPHIGSAGNLESVDEERIEVECEKENAKDVIKVLKKHHPYEEPAIDIYPLLDEEDLS